MGCWLRTGRKQRWHAEFFALHTPYVHSLRKQKQTKPKRKKEKTNQKSLFMKCCLPGYKASWTEMKRVSQRRHPVPRLSGPWCQILCTGRATGPVSPAGDYRPSTQTPTTRLPPHCPECQDSQFPETTIN